MTTGWGDRVHGTFFDLATAYDEDYGIVFGRCCHCSGRLKEGSSPNPPLVLFLHSGMAYHADCMEFSPSEVSDDPAEARRLLVEHRQRILERMGRVLT